MKNYLKIALLVLVFTLFALSSNAQNKNKAQKESEVTFVVNMDCANCAKKIEANLPFTKGIKDLKVLLDDKTVWIKYDSLKTDKAQLIEAIEKLGYSVEGELGKHEADKK